MLSALTLRHRIGQLPRESRDSLFLLLVIAWIVLPQTGNLPWWCSTLAYSVLLWRGRLAWLGPSLPAKLWVLGLLLIAVVSTLLTYKTLLGRDAGVCLVVILLALKTLELRARRDAFVVFFLGFFCLLTNFFYSQSLLTAVSMLVGLLGLLTVLVNAHMPAGRPTLLQASKTAGGMALLGAPIMLMLFVLFPRVSPLWSVPSDAMAGRSGLSASMQVGTLASLALDDSVAMRIQFDAGFTPRQQDLYFRGPVLSRFDGREWRTAQSSFSARPALPANLTVSGAPIGYEVTLEPTHQPWILVMEAATQAPTLNAQQLSMTPDLQWIIQGPVTELVRYKVQSYPNFRHGPRRREPGLQDTLDLPAGFNPQTLALAAEMRRDPRYGQAQAQVMVQAVLERLRSGGYTYTLEPGVFGQHTADEFWFDKKRGFCEHIASSFVVLMRALGIPARIVTGYQGGERNPVDHFWTVRQSDAHAWAEVWLSGQGWIRVDPTAAVAPERTAALQRLTVPPGVVTQTLVKLSPEIIARLRATWEAVNNGWNQWVLNYSQTQQLRLLKNLGFNAPSWEDLGYVLIALVVTASLTGALWAWWDRKQHDPWLRLLTRARRQLARHGLQSHASSTPRQLAEQLEKQMARRHDDCSGTPVFVWCNWHDWHDWHDWLLALEQQRYAPATRPDQLTLQQLQRRYRQLKRPK